MMNRSSTQNRTSRTSRFLLRKSSPFAVTLYLTLIFGSSIFIFLFCTRYILEDEHKPFFSGESQSESKVMSVEHLWDAPFSNGFHPCVKPTSRHKAVQVSDRYITVRSNGGLNQMRAGISDMVAVARIMNATLVIPQLDKRSFWHDTSTFSDIFDEYHFMTTLQSDVKIVKELPKELESIPHARKHFTSWSSYGYYEEMTRLWKEYQEMPEIKHVSLYLPGRCAGTHAALELRP